MEQSLRLGSVFAELAAPAAGSWPGDLPGPAFLAWPADAQPNSDCSLARNLSPVNRSAGQPWRLLTGASRQGLLSDLLVVSNELSCSTAGARDRLAPHPRPVFPTSKQEAKGRAPGARGANPQPHSPR